MATFNSEHSAWRLPLIALVALSGVLGGCVSSSGLTTTGKMTDVSAIAAEKSLSSDESAKYAKTWPTEDWWRAFDDPQLDALIEEALKGNPDLVLADARLRKASAATLGADAARKPTLSGSASVQVIHIPGDVLPGSSGDEDFTPKIVGLSGSYNGSLLGMRHASWEAAIGRERAMEVDVRAARLALSAEVTRTYAGLAHAYRAHDLAQQDAERARQLLDLTLQRVKAGIDGTAQQRLAESVAASTRGRLEQAAFEIERERIALAVLTGKGPDRAIDIARPGPLRSLQLARPSNLPAELIGHRPDIVASRWRVEAATKDIEATKAGFYPSFNLSAALGLVSFNTADLLSLRSRYYSIAPALTLPIFDAGRLRAGLAGSNAGFDAAVAEYNRTLIGAFNDVALQMRSARSLEQQAIEQAQAMQAAREGWDMALQRYRKGIASQIEVLTTQQSVLAAESAMADVEARQINAGIGLIQALGGGYANAPAAIHPDSPKKNQTDGTPS